MINNNQLIRTFNTTPLEIIKCGLAASQKERQGRVLTLPMPIEKRMNIR